VDPNVLHNISYGMYIVSSCKDAGRNGQIANTVFQITSRPVTVAVSLNKKNLTHEFVEASGKFTVSVLDEKAPLSFIGAFGFKSGRKEDKFKGVKYKLLESGCPVVLENTVCYLEARVTSGFDCGTHTLFLGEMTDSGFIAESKPMTYEYYHLVKKGTTPPNAPTFIRGEKG
jgi:flavin reductase (DIM6/NTAB) family NADH-FMN oxidoreductase RutF